MVLNWIWISFFLIAFLMAAGRSLFGGDLQVWSDIMNASFDQAAFAFEISLGLTGVLTLWLGIMKIGEKAGVVEFFGRLISPFFSRLFPGIPKGHPAMGAIFMNISANMLGLDNAATPMGLKAMQEMQSLNPKKDTATDAMIMFLVLNSSGLCLIPISIMMYRAQGGAANPTDVFIPILIATAIATIVGLTALCIRQKIKMDRVIWGWLGAIAATVGAITYFFANLPADKVQLYSTFGANLILFSVIIAFILAGIRQRFHEHRWQGSDPLGIESEPCHKALHPSCEYIKCTGCAEHPYCHKYCHKVRDYHNCCLESLFCSFYEYIVYTKLASDPREDKGNYDTEEDEVSSESAI